MASALSTSEPVSAESTDNTAARPANSIAADAALVLAALGRMQSAAHSDRMALERLRAALEDMADVIAQAKAKLFTGADEGQVLDTAALLDQLEHLVDAMIETAGGTVPNAPTGEVVASLAESPAPHSEAAAEATAAPAETPQPAAVEADQVPTVSAVVSGLANSEPAASDLVAEPDPQQTTTVAMLKAMVEALNASVPSTVEAEAVVMESVEPEVIAPEAAQVPQPIAETPAAELTEPPPDVVVAAAHDVAAANVTVADVTIPELPQAVPAPQITNPVAIAELLASYERMEARPIPPPEEGTAVIFGPKPEPAASEVLAEPTALEVLPEPVVLEILPEPLAIEPAALEMAPAPEPMVEVVAATEVAPETPPPPQSPPAEAMAIPAPEPVPSPPNDAEFDPTDFLFGPEPEPEPAAFLLEPSPSPPPASTLLPPPEFVMPPPAAEPSAAEPAHQTEDAAEPAPQPPAPDPLAPLKAMSEAERIAIFS